MIPADLPAQALKYKIRAQTAAERTAAFFRSKALCSGFSSCIAPPPSAQNDLSTSAVFPSGKFCIGKSVQRSRSFPSRIRNRNGRDQCFRIWMRRIFQTRLAPVGSPPVFHGTSHLLCHYRNSTISRSCAINLETKTVLLLQMTEQIHNLCLYRRVQRCNRFIRHQKLRLHRQCPCNRNACAAVRRTILPIFFRYSGSAPRISSGIWLPPHSFPTAAQFSARASAPQ